MNEDRDPLAVQIGAREIYDQLVGLRDDVRSLTQDREAVNSTLDDHEERLRAIERWKYSVPVAALGGILSAVVTFVKR